jgi:hypothetical protein
MKVKARTVAAAPGGAYHASAASKRLAMVSA